MATPFEYTQAVAIELSNGCSLARVHKKCPLYLEEETKILPSEIVYGVLDVLGRYEYTGLVSFSQYNEPLEDPRLYTFIGHAGEVCPKAKVYIVTNGSFLNKGVVVALCELGVDHVIVSLYGSHQEARRQQIEAFAGDLQIGFYYGGLDDRPEVNWARSCNAHSARSL